MRPRAFVFHIITLSAIGACGRGRAEAVSDSARAVHIDSIAGEAAQYSLIPPPIGWLTDSNVVALATLVNRAPIDLALIESERSSDAQVHTFARDVIREHLALQSSLDSLAAKHRVSSQAPAVQPSVRAPYDSTLSALGPSTGPRFTPDFLAAEIADHLRTIADFGAIAGNATDIDLRGLLSLRAIAMETQHLARARLLATSVASSDSAKLAGRKP